MTDIANQLQSVKIQGFKSIKEMEIELKSLNVLIGANGSGKSNFISLFTLFRRLSFHGLKRYVEKHGNAGTFFHFGPRQTKNIMVDLDFHKNTYHVEFSHSDYDDSLVFDQEYCTLKPSDRHLPIKGLAGESGLGSRGRPNIDIDPAINEDIDKDRDQAMSHTLEYMRKCRVHHFRDTGPGAAYKLAHRIDASRALLPDADNLAVVLDFMKKEHPDHYNQILMTIQAIAPFFEDFYFEQNGSEGDETLRLRWLHRDHDAPLSASQLSDGTARFICLATLFLQPATATQQTTFVVDEPELGLHPNAVEVLAELIKSVAKTRQVIVSTQSVEFANHFEPEDFIVVDEQSGASSFKRLDPEPLHAWLEDYKMGTIWTKNIIGGNPRW